MDAPDIDKLIKDIATSIDYYDRVLAEAKRIEPLREIAVAHLNELEACYPDIEEDTEGAGDPPDPFVNGTGASDPEEPL